MKYIVDIHGEIEGDYDIIKKYDDPKTGKWIRTRTMIHDGELYCDQCGQEHPEQKKIWNFCLNCGASMKVGDAE